MVVTKIATTTQHGVITGKTQTRLVEHFGLDVIIFVDYRAKSQRGVQFRHWTTQVLKEYFEMDVTPTELLKNI